MGWMDYLFGTDAIYKNTINYVRHRNLFGLKSARERFPDDDIKKLNRSHLYWWLVIISSTCSMHWRIFSTDNSQVVD